MTAAYRLISDCLAVTGREGFGPNFLELVEWMQARQLMVFELSEGSARCLMSCHFGSEPLGEMLATRYLDDWFLQDPLLPELMALPQGQVVLRRMEQISGAMPPDYRRLFFDEPGLAGKTAVLAAGARHRMIVNWYYSALSPQVQEDDLFQLAARMLLNHYEIAEPQPWPEPLSVLSERERAVCMGIIDGKKAETIAGDLGVSPATVVTYRKRAYDKLGIGSRAGLFAICRQG